MKNHLYLLAALAMILSMVIVGCAASATIAAPKEPAPEEPTQPQLAARETNKEEQVMAKKKIVPFAPEGVTFTVPEGCTVEQQPFGPFQAEMVRGDIRPFRAVIAFELFDCEYPVELRVKYTAADVKHAELNDGNLRLIKWIDDAWEEFPGQEFFPDSRNPDLGGTVLVELTGPGDPRVGYSD